MIIEVVLHKSNKLFVMQIQKIKLLWGAPTMEQAVDQSSLVVYSVWVMRALSWTAPTTHQHSALTFKMLESCVRVRSSSFVCCWNTIILLHVWHHSYAYLSSYRTTYYIWAPSECNCLWECYCHIQLLSHCITNTINWVVQTAKEWHPSADHWIWILLHFIDIFRSSEPDKSIIHL